MLASSTIHAIENSLRVYEKRNHLLTEEQIDECFKYIAGTSAASLDARTFVLSCQALVASYQAHQLSEILLDRIAGLSPEEETREITSMLGRSLNVALFDTYRRAESLRLSQMDTLIEQAETILNRMNQSDVNTHSSFQIRANNLFAEILVPMLNTEHQSDVAKLIKRFLDIHASREFQTIPDSQLYSILRRSYTPARLILHPDDLASLRISAIDAARGRLSINSGAEASYAHKNLDQFHFLLFSDYTEKVGEYLRTAADEINKNLSDHLTNTFVRNLSWAHETTLSEDIIVTVEKLFFDLTLVPQNHSYLAMATRFGDQDRGERWIEKHGKHATINTRYLETIFWTTLGEPAKALQAASRPLSVYSRSLREKNSESSSTRLPPLPDPMVLYALVRRTQEAVFQRDLIQFSKNARQGKNRKDNNVTVVLAANHLHFLAQLPIAAIERARNDGAEIVSLVLGNYLNSERITPAAAALKDILVPPFYFNRHNPSHAVSSDWEIDYDNQAALYKGINYYYGLHNSLGIIFRRFNVDFENPLEQSQMRRHLVMFQNIHDTIVEFSNDADPLREYRFIVVEVQYGVGFAIRTIIQHLNLPNIRVLHASNGFEGFDPSWEIDGQSGNPVASFHSIADLTDRPNTPLGFRPAPEDIVDFSHLDPVRYRENPVVDAYLSKIDDRSKAAHDRYIQKKDAERRVLMLGTILPDLSIPQDRGFIHRDIANWVQKTAELSETENFTLVVKQHPAELNHEIGFYVSERFVDLLPNNTGNVIVLPYDADFYDAILQSDLVILWSGTSTIELAAMGRAYLACSRYAQEEYPLFAPNFQSAKEYRDILSGRKQISANPLARQRAVDLIHRISTPPFREPSKWPKRQLLNAEVWPPRIDPDLAPSAVDDVSTQRLASLISGTSQPK